MTNTLEKVKDNIENALCHSTNDTAREYIAEGLTELQNYMDRLEPKLSPMCHNGGESHNINIATGRCFSCDK